MFRFFKNKDMFSIPQEHDKANVISDDSRFDIKEAYNELRTNISFSIPKGECKVICITSAIASEGKSTTSVNTSITFAKTGKKILLIDCDLRKPNVARILNIKNENGLSNLLVSDSKIESVINKGVVENLDVITSGSIPPNPVELLSADVMGILIKELSKNYDYIFIDAPPINVVTDAALISKFADGIVMVVRHQSAERKMIQDAVRKLEFVNAKILGFVLNGIDMSKGTYGSYKYKYGGKYKYGYGYGSINSRTQKIDR